MKSMPAPKGWKGEGRLPSPDEHHREDILQWCRADGKLLIDVGWSRDTKSFICLVILDENWDEPVEEKWLTNIAIVEKWLEAAVLKHSV